MPSFESYRGIKRVTPTPTGDAGVVLNDNFTILADKSYTHVATSNPSANDDASNTAGNGTFVVGSRWYNESTNQLWECVDSSTGVADWIEPGVLFRGFHAINFDDGRASTADFRMTADEITADPDFPTTVDAASYPSDGSFSGGVWTAGAEDAGLWQMNILLKARNASDTSAQMVNVGLLYNDAGGVDNVRVANWLRTDVPDDVTVTVSISALVRVSAGDEFFINTYDAPGGISTGADIAFAHGVTSINNAYWSAYRVSL